MVFVMSSYLQGYRSKMILIKRTIIIALIFLKLLLVQSSDHESFVTKRLLTNIAKREDGIKPEIEQVIIKDLPSEEPAPSATFTGLPDNLLAFIFELLNYESGRDFFYVCKRFNIAGKRNIYKRLAAVDRAFFTFPEFWLNHQMACVLSSFFNVSDCKNLHDKYETSYIKMMRCQKSADYTLPLGIHYRLSRYLYEFLYGPDSVMPNTEQQWRNHFLFKISQFNFDKTIEFYRQMNEEVIEMNFGDLEADVKGKAKKYLELVLDFCKRGSALTADDFIKFANETGSLEIDSILPNAGFHQELLVFTEFHFHPLLSPNLEAAVNTFMILTFNQFYSPSLFERISELFREESEDDGEFLQELIFRIDGLGKNRDFALALNERVENDPDHPQDFLNYVVSRNPKAPFVLQEYLDLCALSPGMDVHYLTLQYLLQCTDPNMTQIDIFTQLIKENFYNFQAISPLALSLLFKAYENDSFIYFDIILKYAPGPVNVFINYGSGLVNIFTHFPTNNTNSIDYPKMIAYISSLDPEDPFPLIFIHPQKLALLKELIVDKFDLRKRRYAIDFNPHLIRKMNAEFYKLETLQGRIVTFKQILDAFGIEDYLNIFVSDNVDIEESEENVPIVSMHNFVYMALQ